MLNDVLVTYALGSCMGISAYDPIARVGGLLHVMLPLSAIDPDKAKSAPAMFIDTGLPVVFKECYKAGAHKEDIQVKISGGASLCQMNKEGHYQIGRRNILMLKKRLWKNNVLIHSHDTGDTQARTMSLDIETGIVYLEQGDQEKAL